MTCFWNNRHQVCSKSNNIRNSLGARRPKGITGKPNSTKGHLFNGMTR